MKVLLTGAAGFIGFHVARALSSRGDTVVGIDNLDPYYSVLLKRARLDQLSNYPLFSFVELDISNYETLKAYLANQQDIDHIIHLAAQAGVRHATKDPFAYVKTNVQGHVSLLEAARILPRLNHILYASSSSVYAGDVNLPFKIDARCDKPLSLYGASKRACEMISHSYAHIYGQVLTGLRFFTVYGPWGRPDMAAYLFTNAILSGQPLQIFNHGAMRRDFTYIDDIVAGVLAALDHPPPPDPNTGICHRLFNLGKGQPDNLMDFIAVIEKTLGCKGSYLMEAMQPGDTIETFADIELSRRELGFDPQIPIETGIPRFITWHHDYHGPSQRI